jgi:putative DNA primase/helicase
VRPADLTPEQRAKIDRLVSEWDVVVDGPPLRIREVESLLEPAGPATSSTLTDFTEIIAKPVEFLWRDRIALGKITALAGRPKIGKGLLYSRLIAAVTRGQLAGELAGLPSRAIIVTTEDEPGDTLKPRLVAAGADPSMVSMFQMGSKDEPVPFRVPQDAAELGRRVAETRTALVVIDPLMEFLDGKTDSHKSQSSRHAVSAVNEIARQHGCAVLAIYHLNKGASTDPLLRHEGSAAFTQIVRAGLMLGFDPDDPEGEEGDQRVLAVSSSNLAKLAPSLVYRIEGASVTGDTQQEITTAKMLHIGESSAASHDLLRGREDDDQRAERDEATEFLLEELAGGPRKAREIKDAAHSANVGPGALKRAKRELRVQTRKEGMSSGWVWSLPEGDGPKGTHLVREKPSPSSPSASGAENGHPEGDEIPEGDGLNGTDPFDAEAARLAAKFPEMTT